MQVFSGDLGKGGFGRPFLVRLLADAFHAVLAENWVGGDDRQFFLQRLCNQQSVKGVAMMLAATSQKHMRVDQNAHQT